jgi:single-strand DNA-binding protein
MFFNKVILLGRLTRDPEIITLPSGSQVANFTVAYNRRYLDPNTNNWQEETHYFDVKAFGKIAQRLATNYGKGDLILIEGRLVQEKWLDNQTGQPRSRVRILALDVKLVMRARQTLGEENFPITSQSASAEEIELPSLEELEALLEEGEEKEKPKKGEEKKNKPKKEEDEDFFDDEDLLL